MKQVLFYEAQRERTLRAISLLESLVTEIWASASFLDVTAITKEILAVPAPASSLAGKDEILEEAKTRHLADRLLK